MPLANLTADLYAAAVGQPDIEHRDIWFSQWNIRPRLDGGAGLANDLDVAAVFQQFLEAASDNVVVIEDEHPGHLPTCPSGSACRAHRVKQTLPAGAEPARPQERYGLGHPHARVAVLVPEPHEQRVSPQWICRTLQFRLAVLETASQNNPTDGTL